MSHDGIVWLFLGLAMLVSPPSMLVLVCAAAWVTGAVTHLHATTRLGAHQNSTVCAGVACAPPEKPPTIR